jgi:uncharacterized membrane protein YdbT with pleckstrin-like domain
MSNDPTALNKFQGMVSSKLDDENKTPVERSLWHGYYSPKAMYGTWAISAIVTIVTLVLVSLFGKDVPSIWPITGAAIIIWWVAAIANYIYKRFSVHYELTTQRFIHQAGLLVRRTDRIDVIDIDDVSFTQGIVQRMLGVGTIRLTGKDRTHPEFTLNGIDKVPEIASMIDDVRREERRRRSLHIDTD